LGFGFGQNIPISTLPPVVALTGAELMPVVQNDPNGTPVTMRATARQVAQTLPANPNAVPAAFAQGQTIVSGPGPIFPWVPTDASTLDVVDTWNGRTGAVVMLSADVTGALGFTPYNATNPSGFQTAAQVSASISAAVPTPSSAAPLINGAAAPGASPQWSRGDHIHPTDTSRYAATNPSNFQTAAQVSASLANYLPLSGGTVIGGTAFTSGIILASPTNLILGGGAPGQVLTATATAGVLAWMAQAGGIADAPTDGQLYGRESGTWVVVPSGGGGIADAPNDGTMYARLSAAWTHINHTNIADWTATLAPYALSASVPVASVVNPLMDGVATPGASAAFSRGDHVHPTDTSRAAVTALPAASTTLPLAAGTAAVGVGTTWARSDHVHPASGAPIVISDTAPASPAVGALWWDSVGGQLYVWFNDGNSSQWVIATNVGPALATYLPLGGGVMTGAVALAGVSTAPTPAAGTNSNQVATTAFVAAMPAAIGDNRIINGDMRINQRGVASATTFSYTIDRWQFSATAASNFGSWSQLQLNTGAPAFPYCLSFSSTSAHAIVAADYCQFTQVLEADMISDFAWGTASAQPVTLSFWAGSSLGGTFGGCLGNAAGTRSYPFTFTLAANVWSQVAITIPGDTAGNWVLYGNAASMTLHFDLGSGATYRAPAGAWVNGSFAGANGTVSVIATNGATLSFTGAKLETGNIATPFNRYSLAKSFADCQRYFQVGQIGFQGYAVAGVSPYVSQSFPTQLRAAPTMVITANNSVNVGALSFIGLGPNMGTTLSSGPIPATGNYVLNVNYTASAEL